mmetsp:Transcript_1903/g.4048  ORF Transcript_1903/g.4048 Transcript_1903/m.4048 type:complete len:217 (+) Transcript_1903:110-760(+)
MTIFFFSRTQTRRPGQKSHVRSARAHSALWRDWTCSFPDTRPTRPPSPALHVGPSHLSHQLFVPRLRPLALEALRRPGTVEFGAEQLVHEHAHAKVVVEELVVPVVALRAKDEITRVGARRGGEGESHPEHGRVRVGVGQRRAEHDTECVSDEELDRMRKHAGDGRRRLPHVVQLVHVLVERRVVERAVRRVEPHLDDEDMPHEIDHGASELEGLR